MVWRRCFLLTLLLLKQRCLFSESLLTLFLALDLERHLTLVFLYFLRECLYVFSKLLRVLLSIGNHLIYLLATLRVDYLIENSVYAISSSSLCPLTTTQYVYNGILNQFVVVLLLSLLLEILQKYFEEVCL